MELLKLIIRLAYAKIAHKTYPFLVQLNITNRCNSKCQYCYAKYYSRSANDLSFEKIKRIIDELEKNWVFRINLLGGEPLLRDDIDDIIQHIKSKHIKAAMTTNGILAPNKMDTIKKLDLVCFSLDGRKENNDKNRGPGMFDKTMAGIEECIKAGVKIQLSSVLSKHTVHDVDYMVDLAQNLGCQVGFTTLTSQVRENCLQEHNMTPEEKDIRNAFKRIIEHIRARRPVLFSRKSYEYALTWPDYSMDVLCGKKPHFKTAKCYAGRYFCIIDYNGDVFPCPQLIGKTNVKNLLKDGFKQAFDASANHNCMACSSPCSNDFNLFFGLVPKVLMDHLFSLKKEI